jgi:O-antigen/teichoic acid export membrane protein
MATLETPKVIASRAILPWISEEAWVYFNEYAPTLITELAVMFSQIAAYRLAAHFLGTQGFSEYALVRRTVALIMPIPILGLSVGLPRYISFSKGRNDLERADHYFGATLWCVGVASMACMALINIFPGFFSYLFFGSRAYKELALPLSLMVFGLCQHTAACSYFRGHLQMNRANLLQGISLAVFPVVVFVFAHGSLSMLLYCMGLSWILISTVALRFTPLGAMAQTSRQELCTLLRYGMQRVPGDFFLMALFTLPATLIAHFSGVVQAGFVAFGVSVVSMIAAVFAPVGLVLLPKATKMLAEGAHHQLRSHLAHLIKLTLVGSSGIAVLGWLAIPTAIRLYLGAGYGQVVPIVRLLLIAVVPYCLYLIVRNLVDAHHEYGVTAAILSAGLIVFLCGFYAIRRFAVDSGVQSVLTSFVLAILAITALSSWECWRILHLFPESRSVESIRTIGR